MNSGRPPACSVLVNGTLCVDTLTFADGSRHEGLSGGCGMYFALAAAAIGQPVRLLAAVGEDYPAAFAEQLDRDGVDVEGLLRRPGKTFRWHGHYDDTLDDRDTLGLDFDPAVEALPELPSAWSDTRYAFLGVNAPENQLALRRRLPMSGGGLVIMDTIDLYIDRHGEALVSAVSAVDGLLINQHEVSDLTGRSVSTDATSCGLAANAVFGMADALGGLAGTGVPMAGGLRFVVIKLGPAGSVLCVRGEAPVRVLPCSPASLVDPTGAGDTFAAGLLAYAASRRADRSGEGLAEVLRVGCGWGAVLASFTCEGVGNAGVLGVTRARFVERLKDYERGRVR